jgi:uncharacterized repeat protein (TIGR01451 family)
MVSRTKLVVLFGSVVLLTVLLALGLADVSAQSGVDLSISKWSSPEAPGPVIAGEELFYHLRVYNSGLTAATNVLVTDTLPYGVSYIDNTDDCSYNDVLHRLVCDLGTMERYEDREFDVKVRVDPWAVMETWDGTIVLDNSAVVGSSEEDDDPSDNTVTYSIFVQDSADLSVIKMSKPDTHVRAGQLFTYTIYVENLGPSVARFVGMRDELLSSGDFQIVGYSTDRDDYGMVECFLQSTDPGISNTLLCMNWFLEPKGLVPVDMREELPFDTGRWTIHVVLRANETQDVNDVAQVFPLDQSEPFDGEVYIGTLDPDWSNNSAEDFIFVDDVADLSITKDLDWCDQANGECVAGGNASFSIAVVNNGPSTAENVVVEDLLPLGVTVVGVSGDGSCTTGIPGDPFAPLTCNLGSFAPLERKSFDVEVRIDPDYVQPVEPDDYRELENDAWVYSDIFDPDNSNNRAHTITDIYTYSDVHMRKRCPHEALAGEDITYTIWATNEGPSTVSSFHFEDKLPSDGSELLVTYLGYEIPNADGNCILTTTPAGHPAVRCWLDEIPPGDMQAVYLHMRVNPDVHVDSLYNEIGRTGANSYVHIDETPSCETSVEYEADLSITKTSEPMKIYPGEQKVYHIEVTNNGPTIAPDVMVTDTLPFSVTYEIDNDNCDLIDQNPDVLECHLGNMMPGETKGFDISALVSRDAPPGQITNHAEVFMSGDDGYDDPNLDNNWAEATNLVLEPTVADLTLEKWWEQAPPEWFQGAPFGPEDCYPTEGVVRAGCALRYELAITNTGPLQAENVVVEDVLPAGVTVEGAGPSQGSCTTGIPGDPEAPLTCNLGNIPRDGGAGIEVFVRTDADLAWEMLDNDAVVSSAIPDPDTGNNRSHVLIWVEPFSYLYVEKDGPPEIMAGEQIEYWVNLRNEGPSTAHDVHLDDELPGGVSLLSAQVMIGEGSCAPDSALCSLGDMEPWDNRAVRVRGYVEPWLEGGTVVTNTARASADSPFYQPDPMQPISDTVETTVNSAADLSIRKTSDPYKVYAGMQVRYDIAVTNNGPGNAYEVLVTDTLPSGVGFELSTDPDCHPADGEVVCEWNMLGVGLTRSFQIFARVDPGAEPGTVSNRVWVESLTAYDPVDYNDYASAPILIQGRADLKVQKFGKPDGLVRAGDKLTYTIIVDNLGTGYAHSVTLDDVMKSDGTFNLMEVTSDRDALCDPETGAFQHDLHLTCTLSDTLEVKGPTPGSGRWMISVVVIADEPQDINNVAYAAGSDYDPDLSNNEAIAEHEITAVADLELTKEARGEMLVGCDGETELWLNQVAAGGTVTYTLTVSNTGPSTAENVVVLDEPLPFPDLLEIDVQSISPSQGSCQTGHIVDQRRLSCNLGTILPQESATVSFVAHVPSWVPDNTVLVNDAQAYSDMFDDNNGNDVVTNHTLVSRVADLLVEKTQDPEIALPTMDITYSITVTNEGPSDAEGVFISDTLPAQVLNPTWTCCASGGQCDVPCQPPVCPVQPCPWPDIGLFAQADIPAGEWVIYTVQGVLDVWPCGVPFTNTVEILPPQSVVHPDMNIDPCDENNVDEVLNQVPSCNYDPLVLKAYSSPDSTP